MSSNPLTPIPFCEKFPPCPPQPTDKKAADGSPFDPAIHGDDLLYSYNDMAEHGEACRKAQEARDKAMRREG